ncbi:SusC/RagA family TonB-linked outer membrane protein [Parapedobacter tibetensis]|uniref:SusC/RagA family TonB-linked outer membrane protein n=1 Tax=Parapedobacter tibetensis TaxID=2972951 RepID=UPI00214D54F1|nr:TonB-dependent receptor [Parapedobacter tibetensis]
MLVFSQESGNGIIHGKITDGQLPLVGASVSISGITIGTKTDANGNYSISLATGVYTVVASYVGYEPVKFANVKVTAGEKQELDIEMSGNVLLQEVEVAYGKQRKREVTGSIAEVSAAQLQDMPVGQFAQQLQGKVAGVQIAQSSGQPGRGMSFRIRGAASLFSSSQPLFVIDGLPITGSINNINPSEIETFTVLKDASATALYGSRAANGVILITTKRAKVGDAKVDFNSNYGIQQIPGNRVPNMMNAREFAQFMKERHEDRVKYEGFTGTLDPIYQNPEQYGEGTNWYQLLTRTAPIQNYDLTISTARENSTSTVVAGYQEQQGVIINTGTRLFSLRLNQDLTLADKLKIGFNIAPSYRIDHNNRLNSDGVGGWFQKAVEASPITPHINPDGSFPINVNTPGMVTNINPYALFTQIKDDYKTTRILGNAFLSYEFLEGLSLNTNLGVDKGAETRNYFIPSTVVQTGIATGVSTAVDNYSWTAEANLQYNKTFLNEHHMEAMLGYSAQRFDQESNTVTGTEFPSDEVEWINAATVISGGSSNTTHYSLLSTIARLNYNYKGKYLLSAAIRQDGSSRFGNNRKYGYFPSISAGWIISDESFMDRFEQINLLKLRASYGITGNNSFGNYVHVATLGDYNYVFDGSMVPGITIGNLGNDDLEWERNKQFDIGLDVSLLANRLSLTYDYYHKITDGMIQSRPIPQASGFSSIQYNIGVFEFWGHEIGVSTTNLTGNLQWNSSLNVSFDRNLIKSLVAPGFIRRNNTVSSDYFRNQEGRRLGEFYGFIYEGLYKDAEDLANSAQYIAGNNYSAVGTIKVRDVSGPNGVPDGVIDDVNDRTFIGDPTPDFQFGFSNDFRYKNFDLNITMAGSVGGDILNPVKWAYQTNMDGSRNLVAAAKDRWRSEENPGSGTYPRTLVNTTAIGRSVNSQWVENGSYLTVKNISLGYTVPLKNNLLMKHLRVYASIQQALVITGYTGMNPEINFSGLDATRGIGVDENAYPVPRTYSFGISTSFR